MKSSEPFKLYIHDVDIEKNTVFIRGTKFSKERIIPLLESPARQMETYHEWVTGILEHKRPKDSFSYTTGGKPMIEKGMWYAFRLIKDSIHATPKGYPHVRLYDFRHTHLVIQFFNGSGWMRILTHVCIRCQPIRSMCIQKIPTGIFQQYLN